METPKAEIIKLNPDCQGTHYPQSEIEELERRAMETSLWEEKFHNAAQANARLEGLLEKEQKRFFLSEQSNAKLAKIIEKTLPFVEQMAHHGKCRNNTNLKCMSCEATEVLKEVLPPLEWAEFQASIKL